MQRPLLEIERLPKTSSLASTRSESEFTPRAHLNGAITCVCREVIWYQHNLWRLFLKSKYHSKSLSLGLTRPSYALGERQGVEI